jgi:hypothetical protein
MNLLVTNTRNAQAYGVIRSLRPHAKKIIATMYGPNRFVARLSPAANSRYVDKRYFVPSPVEDWNGRTFYIQLRERARDRLRCRLYLAYRMLAPSAQAWTLRLLHSGRAVRRRSNAQAP